MHRGWFAEGVDRQVLTLQKRFGNFDVGRQRRNGEHVGHHFARKRGAYVQLWMRRLLQRLTP